jgi:tRNA(His) 5'-end guanylyltransferase
VLREFADVRLGYGESDEYSFVLHPGTALYGERQAVTQGALGSH